MLRQIVNLPESNGRKILFELIDEMAPASLPGLLEAVGKCGIRLGGLRFTTRPDWLVAHERSLRKALGLAERMETPLILFSMGFESFDDFVLNNLGKGCTVQDNLRAIALMRQLKRDYPEVWKYSPNEAHTKHGFIGPTPWHTPESLRREIEILKREGLFEDIYGRILFNPLEIPHATTLGHLLRCIEDTSAIRFARRGLLIQWTDRYPWFGETAGLLKALDPHGDNNAHGVSGNPFNFPRYDDKGEIVALNCGGLA